MKKMGKGLLYLCLLLVVFSFSACGSKESKEASEKVAVSKEAKEEKEEKEETKKEKKKDKKEKKDKKDSSEKKKETEEETEEAVVREEETEEKIEVPEGEIRIVVSFSGEADENLMLSAVLRPIGPDGMEVQTSSDDGKLTMTLSDLSAAYDFHLYMGDSPEASTALFNYDVEVKVYLPDSKKSVSYKLSDHMDQIYQEPDGMVLWGVFGISQGEITDYDPSWIFMA